MTAKKMTAVEALARVNQMLSDAQDVLGQHVLYHGGSEAHPLSYRRGNETFDLIEKARRALHRKHRI